MASADLDLLLQSPMERIIKTALALRSHLSDIASRCTKYALHET